MTVPSATDAFMGSRAPAQIQTDREDGSGLLSRLRSAFDEMKESIHNWIAQMQLQEGLEAYLLRLGFTIGEVENEAERVARIVDHVLRGTEPNADSHAQASLIHREGVRLLRAHQDRINKSLLSDKEWQARRNYLLPFIRNVIKLSQVAQSVEPTIAAVAEHLAANQSVDFDALDERPADELLAPVLDLIVMDPDLQAEALLQRYRNKTVSEDFDVAIQSWETLSVPCRWAFLDHLDSYAGSFHIDILSDEAVLAILLDKIAFGAPVSAEDCVGLDEEFRNPARELAAYLQAFINKLQQAEQERFREWLINHLALSLATASAN